MGKTLTNLQSYCFANGWSDQTTNGTTNCTAFINDTLQILSCLKPWPCYQKPYGKVTCKAPANTISAISSDGTEATVTTTDAHRFVLGDVVTITSAEDAAFTAATNDTITLTGGAQFFSDYDAVEVSSTGTLPAGLSASTTYYVGDVSSDTLCLYEEYELDNKIDITDTGSGTHTMEFATSGDGWNKANVEVTSTDSTTTFTFNTTYQGADPASGTVTKDYDNTALSDTRLWRIGTIVRSDRASPLEWVDPDEWTLLKRYNDDTGAPRFYTLHRFVDAAGTIRTRILIYPEPTEATTLYYTWQAYPKILSSGTDYTDWPDTLVWLLESALRVRLAQQDRDTQGTVLYGVDFMKLVNRAFRYARPSNRPILAQSRSYGWNTPLSQIEKTFP